MDTSEPRTVADAIAEASTRTARQVAALETALRSIIDGAELVSTDDEHDPEGATIAYERAQTTALLHQAREDLARLSEAAALVAADGLIRCADCSDPIATERLVALPTTLRCMRCATSART